jgi:hypothetical protein
MDRLIYFFPSFMEDKNLNHQHYKQFKINNENHYNESAAYNFGSIILKLFGNLFLSVDSYQPFEEINFYEKIFFYFMLLILKLTIKNILSIFMIIWIL